MSERKLRRPIPNDKPRELSAKDISSTEQTAVIPGRSLERRTPKDAVEQSDFENVTSVVKRQLEDLAARAKDTPISMEELNDIVERHNDSLNAISGVNEDATKRLHSANTVNIDIHTVEGWKKIRFVASEISKQAFVLIV